MTQWDERKLEQITKDRKVKPSARPLKNLVQSFMKRDVYPRQRKLAYVAEVWQQLLPDELIEHTCLENIRGGRLKVLVDNAPCLHELTLLKENLLTQLYEMCSELSISDIKFVRGSWYRTNEEGIKIAKYHNGKNRKA